MAELTLTLVLLSALKLLPITYVTGKSTTTASLPTTTDDDDDDSKEDDEDDDYDYNYAARYLWPIMFSIVAALIFAVIYTCSKKHGRCRRGDRGNTDTTRRSGNASGRTGDDSTNGGFDDLPSYPGTAALNVGTIEMVPPPYCDKPPDYSELYDETPMQGSDGTLGGLDNPVPVTDDDNNEANTSEAHQRSRASSESDMSHVESDEAVRNDSQVGNTDGDNDVSENL